MDTPKSRRSILARASNTSATSRSLIDIFTALVAVTEELSLKSGTRGFDKGRWNVKLCLSEKVECSPDSSLIQLPL